MGLDKDDIKQLIAILQKGLSDDTDEIEEKAVVSKNKKQTKNTTKKKPKRPNLFESMEESTMHKDDVAIDRKLKIVPPTQRSRSYKPLKVKCRVCGREEGVNPSLVESTERYKCNKCSTSAG